MVSEGIIARQFPVNFSDPFTLIDNLSMFSGKSI